MAASAVTIPVQSTAGELETPKQKVDRLAREMSLALNDYDEGRWHVEIHPSKKRELPIGFLFTDIKIPPMLNLKNQIQRAKEAMEGAYPGRGVIAYSSLHEKSGRATIIITTDEMEG